ncbi:MAG: Asp23/Gls24 family envelope stress response protein [Candidatus Bipolaricaulaceae bacterium]
MARPEEEFVPEAGPEEGKVSISKDVIATIAGIAAADVKGIASPRGGAFPKGEAARRLVETELAEGRVRISVKASVVYGHPVRDVAQQLQERIKSEVEKMTALPVDAVDVEITRVVFPEEEGAFEGEG